MDTDWNIVTESQGKFLDFSVNTNPFGIPPKMAKCGEDFVSTFGFYPDPKCQTLRKALSAKYAIPPEFIYCGSGADDILYRLVFSLHPKRALILEPTFEEYGRALSLIGCEISHFQLKEEQNFQFDMEQILSAIDRIDILFICNPNNPTGQLIKREEIVQILKKCEDNNVVCVVDECFMEMLRDWRTFTVKQESKSYHNLVVVDAFTKTYAIPGLRLGFAVTQRRELLDSMQTFGQEFNVSTPAQLAGLMALSDTQYMEKTYALIEEERRWLTKCFIEFGIHTYPAVANFFLAKAPVANFNELLLTRGIKTRDCTNFNGLGCTYCRFAIRRHEENASLAAALKSMKSEDVW
jgi:threonine-phosphate decarboxylase